MPSLEGTPPGCDVAFALQDQFPGTTLLVGPAQEQPPPREDTPLDRIFVVPPQVAVRPEKVFCVLPRVGHWECFSSREHAVEWASTYGIGQDCQILSLDIQYSVEPLQRENLSIGILNLSSRILNALMEAGITTLGELTSHCWGDLTESTTGFRSGTHNRIVTELKRFGLSLAPDDYGD